MSPKYVVFNIDILSIIYQVKGVITCIYNTMVCIIFLDTHSVYAHTKHIKCFQWANITADKPT